jgi:hypothetical protein
VALGQPGGVVVGIPVAPAVRSARAVVGKGYELT